MRAWHVRLLLLTTALPSACTGSPSAPPSPSVVSGGLVEGRAVSVLDGAAQSGLTVQVETARAVTTDAAGYFQTETRGPGAYATTVSGASIVERRTRITGPTSGLRLPLIPRSFDLVAFDQMFRSANARLQRWTTPPSLVVLASVMSYRAPADEYTATAERLSDEEVSLLVAHLTEGLAILTGGAFTAFSRVDIERPESGARTSVTRHGAIVAGRYSGILTFAQTIGYGRWAEDPDGTVVGGAMFLDRGFDRDDGRRRLLRIHELGHALGYLHVESRASIMNPSIGPEPTEFDRAAARIAFERPPGNVSPDTDPMAAVSGPFGGGPAARWTGFVP